MGNTDVAEVLLDVDCSLSGGASYAATREWSMEQAGPARSKSIGSRNVNVLTTLILGCSLILSRVL